MLSAPFLLPDLRVLSPVTPDGGPIWRACGQDPCYHGKHGFHAVAAARDHACREFRRAEARAAPWTGSTDPGWRPYRQGHSTERVMVLVFVLVLRLVPSTTSPTWMIWAASLVSCTTMESGPKYPAAGV